ncbi:MAG: xanthine dehydrogenase family protein molybdopterin-binding subunit [Rhodospirillales bacterium]|jgi:CO/xanthine dehydrogenase Mo-binding subunit|nr:xanthine dehydrogenase family protein molybdopterin-binding subunit [Rhodospirillales bacterium]MDP6645800.1 xanthine dehydrogenase family protein molybdopterin-binding subunit [Rhodospirillales bacterium]
MAYKLIGKDFTPPDVLAKVTGKAKYAEDMRADGMVYCRILGSPMPHARVRNIDDSEAKKVKGFLGVLTADQVPSFPPPNNPILNNEPRFVGEPILAVAAETETAAAEAVNKIKLDLEPLPFVTDPLESLFPRGPDARTNGNVANVRLKLQKIKWTAKDFAEAGDDKLPTGKPAEQWQFGDVEGNFKKSDLVIEETFVTAGYAHHAMEPRSAMAYWQNGKCFLFGSAQSQQFLIFGLSRYVGIKPPQLVYSGAFCGGGFGSKGGPYAEMAIPAHMSKKLGGRPVLMRVSRDEEFYFGKGRPGFQGSVKIGFRKDGRILACDMYIVHENGPNTGFWDFRNAGSAFSIVFQPEAMRWRGISVLTNTTVRGPQRGPGENQTAAAMEPIIAKAARKLGLDQVAIRRINAPDNNARYGAKQGPVTSAYLKDALDKGAKLFNWDEKKKESGKRNGSKVIGVGVGSAYHSGGANGFDGLVRITPDGKLHVHNGSGNLGTYSYAATSRAAAEALGADWENVIIERGDSRKGLPFVLGQFGSNSTYTQTRSNWVAGLDAKAKLQEIAAKDLGGAPGDYDVTNGKVFNKSNPSKSMSWAKAAQRAIELGGKYSGKEPPKDINPITKWATASIAGSGLIGVAKDKLPKKGVTPALAAAFVKVEVDTETGKVVVLDHVEVADCGTAVHPQSLATQIKGGAVMGYGLALSERYFFDPKLGLSGSVSIHNSKPPTILDTPSEMTVDHVGLPDESNPVGAKGVGEPVQGAAAAAILVAISDALGGHMFNRTPVVPDMIINAAAGRPQSHKPLAVNTQ